MDVEAYADRLVGLNRNTGEPSEFKNEMTGPYSTSDWGACAHGHPLNAQGRCEALNEEGSCVAPADGSV